MCTANFETLTDEQKALLSCKIWLVVWSGLLVPRWLNVILHKQLTGLFFHRHDAQDYFSWFDTSVYVQSEDGGGLAPP